MPFFAAVGRATNLFSKFFHCFHPHLPVFGPEYDGQVGVLLATFIAVVALDVLGLALFNVNAVSVEPVVAVLTTSAIIKFIQYNDTRKIELIIVVHHKSADITGTADAVDFFLFGGTHPDPGHLWMFKILQETLYGESQLAN